MKKKRSKKGLYIQIFLVLGVMLGVLALFNSEITGFAIFNGNVKLFTINEIVYDDTVFVFDKGIKFKGIEEITRVEKDVYSLVIESDYFDGISGLDSEVATIEGSFDVVLDREMAAGERLGIYMKRGLVGKVYACPKGEECSYPGLGSFNYDGEVGEYYITLSSGGDSFTVFTEDTIRVDLVVGVYNGMVDEVITTYPEEGFVESVDFWVEDLSNWEKFIKDSTGSITYFYSSDSGENWKLIENNDLSSVDASTGKIRFKIVFVGDGSNTPILKKLGLTYTLSKVGIEPMPGSEFSRKYFIDREGVIPFEANITTYVNFSDKTNLEFKFKKEFSGMFTKGRFFDESIVPSDLESIGRFEEVTVSSDVNENLISGIMKVYYTDEEITGLDESSLKLYYYDESEWVVLDSGVNTEENYVWANIDHFSVFAILGEETVVEQEEDFEDVVEELVEEEVIVEEVVEEITVEEVIEEEVEEDIVIKENESEDEFINGEDLITGYSIVEGDVEMSNSIFILGAIFMFGVLIYFVLIKKKK